MAMSGYGGIVGWLMFFVGILVFLIMSCCTCKESEEVVVQREHIEEQTLAAHEEPPALQVQLPYFPYSDGGASETAECAICLEPLRQGQLCSEVPACRHAFHGDCLGVWAKTKGSCPLCRAKIIVLGSDDMV